ncbi:MAG TPA: MarR family transcriptional regulator [Burkholderiaceae bacterium]|jgi:DNA-binding MarR family transcriptional regulator
MTAKPFLPVVRELVRCYQAFENYSAAHIRAMGLTPSQFDIIATLGNTPGMTSKQLGEKTLITKGTLTGVVDRLLVKNLVRRVQCEHDGRSQIVQLTAKGEALFDKVFPAHVAYMNKVCAGFKAEDYASIQNALSKLHSAFDACEKME